LPYQSYVVKTGQNEILVNNGKILDSRYLPLQPIPFKFYDQDAYNYLEPVVEDTIKDIKDYSKKTKNYIYWGPLVNNKMHGEGKILFLKTGYKYTGHFENNKITGYGTFEWPNGDVYRGDMVDGIMHGNGVYTYGQKPGQKYEGEFVNGLKEGKGKLTFANGNVFEGNFIQGKPKGTGILNSKLGQSLISLQDDCHASIIQKK
jgi:hypothetical protein